MKLYEKLERTIDLNKSVLDQSKALAQYDNLSHEEILELAKCHKYSQAGIVLQYLGPIKLRQYLPLFLEFLMDRNWPGYIGAANMLVDAGAEIIPEIKRVIQEVGNDPTWHLGILVGIVREFPRKLTQKLVPELLLLIKRGDREGASIEALWILQNANLISKTEIKEHYYYLLDKYKDDKSFISDLKDEIRLD